MPQPCEFISQYILPAFRSIVARKLVEEYGYSQAATSRILGTTPELINLYLHSKRGNKLKNQIETVPSIQSAIDEVIKNITSEKNTLADWAMFCKICTIMRRDGNICHIHKEMVSLPEDCNICQTISEY
ncbi:MAG: hypothetical protein NWF08_02270 [Candidatus Bathyarchaeota archaeon]|nr:hypothetical protein [Candidatus Bathyarchaeota archaeon]